MFLFPKARAQIKESLRRLFSDEGLKTTIMYVQRGPTAWDETLLRNVTTETETAVSAIQLKHNNETVKQSGSADVQVGDRFFIVRYEDLPTTPSPSINDAVKQEGQTLDIKAIEQTDKFIFCITVEGG